jgi:hypothetical protein
MATFIVRVHNHLGGLRGVITELSTGTVRTFSDGPSLLAALNGYLTVIAETPPMER